MATERPTSWSRAQRLLHWAIAALVLLAAPMGVYMVSLPFRQLLLKFLLYQLHKTIGITAFVLALGQLALHWRRGRPPWVECTAPGSLDNGLAYAARLKVSSCQAVRMSAGLRWPFFSISHSAL
jgi:cytochrome b561